MTLWIGVDDTDWSGGGCTTYVGAVLIRRLESLGFRVVGFPRLIRLNPNCPFKTRGNAAVAVAVEGGDYASAERVVKEVVEEFSGLGEEGTEPGAALYLGEPPKELKSFYWRAVREIVPLEEALSLAERIGAKLLRWKGGRGVIGALAAIGADLSKAKTYELIAHRRKEYWGTVRHVDTESVYRMDEVTKPLTFDNVDSETGEVRITPHTPCPVLLGIRGVSPGVVLEAYKMLKIGEPVEMVTVFETNQGTDVHLIPLKVAELRDGVSAIVEGVVSEKPRFEIGGHLFFKLKDDTGEITCAAYEPTKGFRHTVSKLIPGDKVIVYGAVKDKPYGLTLNLEKIYVKELVKVFVKRAPSCPRCGRKMKSVGAGKGYRCRRCGIRVGPEAAEVVKVPRNIKPGFYEVPPSARRHLAKPLSLPETSG